MRAQKNKDSLISLFPHQNRLVKGDMRDEFSREMKGFRLLAERRVLFIILADGQ